MDFKIDPYAILEVSTRASPEIIQAAYHALVRKWKYNNEGEIGRESLKQLISAFDTLSDPKKKALYDEQWKDLAGKVVGGRYRVLERVGQGDYYYDYKGEHVIRKLPVLIRQCSEISPQMEEVLLNEAEDLWDLRHHSLSSIRDMFRLDDGSLAIVMSYIGGKTLSDYVTENGPIDPEDIAWIAERALNTLWYMHDRGVIHRGVNPNSIIIQDHSVVLSNLTRSMTDEIGDAKSRDFAKIFAPPEEGSGLPFLPESDIYSLGLSMIFGLSGGLDHVLRREIPKGTPDPLVRFFRKLIIQEVTARPSSAEELFKEIPKVRMESFGRLHSEMKPIQGLSEEDREKNDKKGGKD